MGVRDRCLDLQCCTLSRTLCEIPYVFTTFADKQHYVGSGLSYGWCVSGTVDCALVADIWVRKTGAFVLNDMMH